MESKLQNGKLPRSRNNKNYKTQAFRHVFVLVFLFLNSYNNLLRIHSWKLTTTTSFYILRNIISVCFLVILLLVLPSSSTVTNNVSCRISLEFQLILLTMLVGWFHWCVVYRALLFISFVS